MSPGGVFNNPDDEFVCTIEKLVSLGRIDYSEEYGSQVQSLWSDASSYMNGQNVVVDGGRSIWQAVIL